MQPTRSRSFRRRSERSATSWRRRRDERRGERRRHVLRTARAAPAAADARLALAPGRGARLPRRRDRHPAPGGDRGDRSRPGSIFLHDKETGELYTYISTGLGSRQIRLLDDLGIAGAVFHSGVGEIVHDAARIPASTATSTSRPGTGRRSVVCAPIRNAKGETIGVAEMLNKVDGTFETERPDAARGDDRRSARSTLEALQRLERTTRERQREVDFLNLVSDITSELELATAPRVMGEATRMLNCRALDALPERREDQRAVQLRRRRAGARTRSASRTTWASPARPSRPGRRSAFPYAYADLRFNPSSTARPGTSRARSCACRSSTRTARRSASRRC